MESIELGLVFLKIQKEKRKRKIQSNDVYISVGAFRTFAFTIIVIMIEFKSYILLFFYLFLHFFPLLLSFALI